jgi:hypothetical protein
MRIWFFHPLIFYPLALVFAALVIGVSIKPQAFPRAPAPVTATADANGALIVERAGFNSPDDPPEQHVTVTRDFLGNAQTLRIAVLPNLPPPQPQEHGVRILLSQQNAAQLSGKPLTVEVSYNSLSVNAASALAVSSQGGETATWVQQPAPPQPGTLRFELPAQSTVNAIGLRAVSTGSDQAYGLEITRIRIIPHA